MALPNNHPMLKEYVVNTSTNSIASTPLACVARMPIRGRIVKYGGVSHGAFTTDCTVAVATLASVAGGTAPGSGTALTSLTLTASNSAAGTSTSAVPASSTILNEDDLVSFTPSGSTGTTIGGTFYVVIQAA